ncbi:MAG: tetratricopeptide repeat protein, partial [Myxococcales bacterium]
SLLGRAQLRLERHEAALGTFERRLRDAPEKDGSHFFIGETLRRLGRCEEALQAFAAELENVRSGYATAAGFGRAQALRACGRNDEAVEAYRAYLGLRPDDVEAWQELVTLLAELGRVDEAAGANASAARALAVRERSLLPPMPRYW